VPLEKLWGTKVGGFYVSQVGPHFYVSVGGHVRIKLDAEGMRDLLMALVEASRRAVPYVGEKIPLGR
jgi:hypothetical protein